MKKIKNNEPKTKFTGSYKEECIYFVNNKQHNNNNNIIISSIFCNCAHHFLISSSHITFWIEYSVPHSKTLLYYFGEGSMGLKTDKICTICLRMNICLHNLFTTVVVKQPRFVN